MKVFVHQAIGFRKDELKKLNSAVQYLQEYCNSAEFKDKIITARYLGKYQFANNDGLSNEQVYNLIMSGKEALQPTEDGEWDISLTIYNTYWRGRNVIGYTYPNTSMQWINRRFFSWFTPEQIAGNLAHEYCHKLGFDHDFNATIKRQYSIPYVVGDVVAAGSMNNKFNMHKD